MTSINMNLKRFAELYRGKQDERLPYAIIAAWGIGGLVLGKVAEVTGFTDFVVSSFNTGADFVGQQANAVTEVAYDALIGNDGQLDDYQQQPNFVPNPDTLGDPRINPLLDSVELG